MRVLSRISSSLSRTAASVIALRNPDKAVRFLAFQQAMGVPDLKLSYHAADRKDPGLRRWRPTNQTGDALIYKDAALARARARDMERNNDNVSGALRKIANNVVFRGIFPQAQCCTQDGKPNRARAQVIEKDFRKWAKAVKWKRKQKQAIRRGWIDGGVFVRMFPSPTLQQRGLVPLGIELLEVDHLDQSKNELLPNGNVIKKGFEYTPDGFEAAYWLFPEHPGSSGFGLTGRSLKASIRVDAATCLFFSDPERPSQSLPIPWMISVIRGLHNFDEYDNDERLASRLAAKFGIFIVNKANSWAGGSGAMGNTLEGNPLAGGGDGKIPDHIGAASIHELPDGKEVQIASNPRPGNNHEAYARTSLRHASTGFGMSSASFSNDYTDATMSALRHAIQEERRGYRVQQDLLIDELCDVIWPTWLRYRALFGMGNDMDVEAKWELGGWDWIDPYKDAKAAEILIKQRIAARGEFTSQRGSGDWEDTIVQIGMEETMIAEHAPTEPKEKPNAKKTTE